MTDKTEIPGLKSSPVSTEARRAAADASRDQRALLQALAGGQLTVPELAAASGLSPARVLWLVSAMRKYGRLREIPGRGEYPYYAATEER